MHVIGLDIGGANIKAAHVDGQTETRPFEIWKEPARLPRILKEMLQQFDHVDQIAVTMTAELADCFQTKSEGVDCILSAVEEASAGHPIHVWQTGAEFVDPAVAREIPLLVSAANWHALATWIGRIVPQDNAILIDIGTTTTDLIPLRDGVPVPRGLTDCERLQCGELVYSGVRRTPLCAIAHTVPFRDGYCPLAAELFATTLDVYLELGDLPENENDRLTANGRPATREAAQERLARMLCCDRTEFGPDDAQVMARFLADVQRQRIAGALDRVLANLPGNCDHVLISGSGGFLARRVAEEHRRLESALLVSLPEMFGERSSESACALAVSRLAAERA